jgi:hypothetical protein
VCTIGLTLGLKFKSEDRGVIYQTKGKDLIYTSMQSLGSHLRVEQDLNIRDRNPETRCYSSRVDKRRLNLVVSTISQTNLGVADRVLMVKY